MARVDFGRIDEFESVKFADADEKVMRCIRGFMFEAKRQGAVINWDKFKEFLKADAPMALLVPDGVIDRCIMKVREDENAVGTG